MRITFVMPGYTWKPGGGSRIIYELASKLVARNHKICIVHPSRITSNRNWAREIRNFFLKPKFPWVEIDPGVEMRFVPDPTEKNIPPADFIFATYAPVVKYVAAYSPEKGIKCYLIQHYETFAVQKEKLDAIWRLPFKKIVVSQWLKAIGTSLGINNITYIPDAIDHDRFKITRKIEERPQCVAMLFSRWNWKGSEDGLKAIINAKKRLPQLTAILYGIDRRPPGLPGWIKYFHNPSQQDLVGKIYNDSAVFLCPSHSEGFGLPPAEAMACGCAVVTTDCGGNRDYAIDGETALLSPPHQPEILADNIVKLMNNPQSRFKLAETGCKKVLEFNWNRSIELFEKFFIDNHENMLR